MARHIVLGAGPIGRAIIDRLVRDGHDVGVVTRSATQVPGTTAVGMAGDDPRLREVVDGAASVVIATNPPYDRWAAEWPPLLRNVLSASEASGARLVLIGNLYGYAPGTLMTAAEPLRPTTRKGAVRTRLWEELLDAHRAGRVQTTEIRASDYYGPEALTTDLAHAGRRLVEPVLAGRTAYVVGDPDAPHSWTAVGDIAATAVAAIGSDHAWGRPWIVPTDEPRSLREMATDIAAAGGARRPRLRRIPRLLVTAAGLVTPLMREMREVLYQHDAPFVSDGSETTDLLGVPATPWREVIEATVDAASERVRSS